MQGKVKWFSKERGYGFIVGEDGIERYFNVRDVSGSELPQSGDIVNFEPSKGKRGPRATSVTIISKDSSAIDDRVICPNCGKKMVPRIITYRGSLAKSVCPFCGETYKNFSQCFIATAVYGDINAPEVVLLRQFRDQKLSKNIIGRVFIKIYYVISPSVALFLKKRTKIAKIVKKLLDLVLAIITISEQKNIKRGFFMDRRILSVIISVAGIFLWFMPLVSWQQEVFGDIMNFYQTGYHIGGIAYLLLFSLFSYAVLSWFKIHQLRIIVGGLSLLICLIFLFQARANTGWGLIGLTILSLGGIILSVMDLKEEEKSNKA